MPAPIETLAILYRPGTAKRCSACVFITGVHCEMWDADTSADMVCGLWLDGRKHDTINGEEITG